MGVEQSVVLLIEESEGGRVGISFSLFQALSDSAAKWAGRGIDMGIREPVIRPPSRLRRATCNERVDRVRRGTDWPAENRVS